MKPINTIATSYTVTGESIRISLTGDGMDLGDIAVQTGASLSQQEASMIAAAGSVIAGQATMASQLAMRFPLPQSALLQHKAVAQLLYDAHAYAQRKPFVDMQMSAEPADNFRANTEEKISGRKKCLLLWSGGKDSLAALLILRANGYEVTGVHAPINYQVRELEREAAEALAKHYALPLYTVTVQWDSIRALTRRYSTSYDIFPVKNSVPHGRDYFLAFALAPLARQLGAHAICAAFDRGTWLAAWTHEGRNIVYDSQSLATGGLMDEMLRLHLGLTFFSPTAGFYEFSIFKHLLEHETAAWEHIASCFWDKWCGQCYKCLKYALMQRVIGREVIRFKAQPIAPHTPLFVKLVASVCELTATPNMICCMATLLARGELGDMPELAAQLSAHKAAYETICIETDALYAQAHPLELAPHGFQNKFFG